ncbi:MAG: zinc metallopeptidase [Candidatus Brocadiia bacterium]
MPIFDWTMWLLVPGIILGLYAQLRVSSAYAKYSKVPSSRGFTGAKAAKSILAGHGFTVYQGMVPADGDLNGISIEAIPGHLTDHFDPKARVVRLSNGVYNGDSLAAIGVAAHEAGHAIQHQTNYLPIMARAGLYPVAALGSSLWMWLVLFGLFMSIPFFIDIGIFIFTGVLLFQLVTLPVEFNASKRAMVLLTDQGIIAESERPGARAVLNAAAMTYVAAALMAILQLVRLLIIRNRSRD